MQFLEVGDILILGVGVELDFVQSQITENAVKDNTEGRTRQIQYQISPNVAELLDDLDKQGGIRISLFSVVDV